MKYVLLSCILGMLVLGGCATPKPRELVDCRNTPEPQELKGYGKFIGYMVSQWAKASDDNNRYAAALSNRVGLEALLRDVEFSFKDIKTKGEKDGVFTCTATLEYRVKTPINFKENPHITEPIEYTLRRAKNGVGIGMGITKPDIKAY